MQDAKHKWISEIVSVNLRTSTNYILGFLGNFCKILGDSSTFRRASEILGGVATETSFCKNQLFLIILRK